MTPAWPVLFGVVAVAAALSPSRWWSAPAADLVVTGRMHHLRLGVAREWAEFPERAEGAALVLPFEASAQRHRADPAPAPSRPEAVLVRAA